LVLLSLGSSFGNPPCCQPVYIAGCERDGAEGDSAEDYIEGVETKPTLHDASILCRNEVFEIPQVVGDSRCHRWCASQGLVNSHEIVVRKV
jgi:hypothetical protein